MSDLLAKFGLDSAIGDLLVESITNPTEFSVSDNTWITTGNSVMYKASINGQPLQSRVALRPGATLNRISVENRRKYNSNSQYLLVTGTFRNVQMDIEVLHEGEWITLINMFKLLTGATDKSDAEMEIALNSMNVKITQPQVLLFQQFGADEQQFDNLCTILEANGFHNTSVENKNVLKVLSSDAGVPITGFQVGRMDRTESRPHGMKVNGTDRVHGGQGFLDFVDAQFSKYIETAQLGKTNSILNKKLVSERDQLTEEQTAQIKNALSEIKTMMSNIAQRGAGWTGTQREVEVDEILQVVTEKNTYWSQRAPIGRFNLNINGVNTPISLWRDRTADAETTTVSSAKLPTINPFAGIETP